MIPLRLRYVMILERMRTALLNVLKAVDVTHISPLYSVTHSALLYLGCVFTHHHTPNPRIPLNRPPWSHLSGAHSHAFMLPGRQISSSVVITLCTHTHTYTHTHTHTHHTTPPHTHMHELRHR